MLRSEEVNKFILYIPVTSSTQIIEIIGNHKLIHFYPTGRNDHFSKEQRELEKQRNKLKFILTEYLTFKDLKEQSEPSIFFDLEDVYGKLTRLKEIQESTSKSIQKISEDLFTLKESSSFNEFYLVGTLENEKCFLFEKVLYEVLKRNVIFKSQDIPSVEKISFGTDINNLALENDTLKEKDIFLSKEMKKEQFFLPTKSNRRSYQILLHSEETFLKISKIFQSLGGKIVIKEKILNKHKNILHCSTLLAQLKKIYINNEINMKYLLSRNILKVNELKIKNERELKIYNFLSECFFNKNSFVALCFVPKRYLYKFKKIVEYVNQEYSLAIEERNVLIDKSEDIKESETMKSEIKKSEILKSGKEVNKEVSKELAKEVNNEKNEGINEVNKEKNEVSNEVNKEVGNEEIGNISKSFLLNEEEFIPPSFFHTGKFTQIYQELTNTFEVPKYGELNPGIFSVFFFPFFFGMMFSDTLHGLILLFLGIFLIYSKKVNNYFKESELLKIVENAKYLLISMGIYSIYFGLLFCDFGGVELKYNFTKISYFGVKHMADQKEFINKLKMKMSIILGAMHMLAGIILGFVNKSDNLISLISITVSYLCFVGYLVFLIFYKWVCEVNVSLINELVEMYTKPFDKKNLFSYQKEIQLILIVTLILSMLVLFLNKPVRDVKNVDLWVEQSIHSIEYGVSLVSNTASYLRLWAVSLAHGTLTEILHANTFGKSFLVGIIALPLYLMMTFGLLIGLEGTSATLHALRLNWIEFSGKFMRGGGVEYKAFSFDEECD